MDNFDTEKFIIEIHSRPSIWDNTSTDYSNRDLRRKCWQEIVNLFGGRKKTIEQEKDLRLSLQKRWKSIRSCYAREVKRQRNVKSSSGANTRKSEYIYFKQLQFLRNVLAIRESEEYSESIEVGQPPKQKFTRSRKRQFTEEDHGQFVPALNNSIEQKRRETAEQRLQDTAEVDEDRLFLLSLQSTLKNLPPHVKMATKIKMLTLLNDASDFSCNRQTSELNPAGSLVNRKSVDPGYSTQRQRRAVATEYFGTSSKANTNYPNETITNSYNSRHNPMNTMTLTNSPSDAHDSLDSKPFADLFVTQESCN